MRQLYLKSCTVVFQSTMFLHSPAGSRLLSEGCVQPVGSCTQIAASSLGVMQVLLDKGVEEGKILFLSLIAAPEGVHKICGQYPRVKVVTTEIDEGIAPDFQVIPGKWMTQCLAFNCYA